MYTLGLGSTKVPLVGKMDSLVSERYSRATKKTCPNVAVMPLRYELEKYEVNIQACDCRTTLLVRRQVTHACESYWSDPRLMSFIQEPEESGHSTHKGRKAERTSLILRAPTLGFIYTLDVLLSKLPRSVSVSSNDKVLTRCCY